LLEVRIFDVCPAKHLEDEGPRETKCIEDGFSEETIYTKKSSINSKLHKEENPILLSYARF